MGRGSHTCSLNYKVLSYAKQDTLGKKLPELWFMSQQTLPPIIA